MPEMPEVETIRRGLESRVVGKTITEVVTYDPKIVVGNPEQLVSETVTQIVRRGKLLIFELDSGTHFTVHLKMTGQLIWQGNDESVMGGHPSETYLAPHPHKHTRVAIHFSDGSTLYFNDLRRFGRVSVHTKAEMQEHAFVQKLGPEPLDKQFTAVYLTERIAKHPSQSIKAFLLDQENIAGLGNIYADESLFRAAILPTRRADSLKPGEIRNLFDAIQETLELALMYGGSSERDYVNAIGEKGTYLRIANVYHRTGLDCSRCNAATIQRVKVAGRSTHFCPVCQR